MVNSDSTGAISVCDSCAEDGQQEQENGYVINYREIDKEVPNRSQMDWRTTFLMGLNHKKGLMAW